MSTTLPQAPRTVAPQPAWKSILECAALEVFEMMASVRLSVVPSPLPDPAGEFTSMVGLAGALCGMLVIRCSTESAADLAERMLGPGAQGSSLGTSADALGELCNVVAGNFKAKIGNLADHCMLSVPTVIRGASYDMQVAQPIQTYDAVFEHARGRIWVSLIVHPCL